MDLGQQPELRVRHRRDVEQGRFPLEALAPDEALQSHICFRARVEKQSEDGQGAVPVRVDRVEERRVSAQAVLGASFAVIGQAGPL